MDSNQQSPTQKSTASQKRDKAFSIVGIVLCVLLVPALIVNIVMIIKSFVEPDKAPDFFGITPMYVMTESMEPTIDAGDLVLVKAIKAEELKAGDVISFYDPASKTGAVVTHRIIDVETKADGKLQFWTKGDNPNNSPDKEPVPAENVVGRYMFRIPLAGHVAMFMQTTPGLIICVVVPLILLVGYDLIRRQMYDKKKESNMDELMAELEALRAQKEAANAPKEPAEEAPAEETPPAEEAKEEEPKED